jgi:hypothetical protein
MKTLIASSAIALVLFLVGCSDKIDSPVSPQQKQTAPALSKNHGVPFNTTYEAVFQITPTSATTGHAVGIGSGEATHVGHYTSISSDNIRYTSATGGIITDGTHSSYAANGDELYATFTGTFAIANGITTNTINFIFNGGTGRFADLHGEVQVVVTTDDVGQLTQELSGSGSGWIIY